MRTAVLLCRIGLLVIAAAASGCMPLGAIIYKTAGPMPVEAKYTPQQKPMLVFVERYAGSGGSPGGVEGSQEAEALAVAIQKQLAAREVAPQIDPTGLATLRIRDPMRFRAMTVSQIGAAMRAEQVLYVDIMQSSMQMTAGSDLVRGQMAVRVRMIDVASGDILWPLDSMSGHTVSVQSPIQSMREGVNPQSARAGLIRQTAESVARLFYKWKPEYDTPPE